MHPALPPVNRNIDRKPAIQPENIRILKDGNEAVLTWDPVIADGGDAIAYYVVYGFKGKKAGDLDNPANILTLTSSTLVSLEQFPISKGYHTFVVTSINRYKEESQPRYAVTRKL